MRKFLVKVVSRLYFLFPEWLFLRIRYYLEMGKPLHLDNPETMNEKLQWLKLYNRRPEYTQMVDKISAKEYVAKLIGDKYIVPTLGVWNHYDEIDFDRLPDSFVLKTNHSGGSLGVVICKDKSGFDKGNARKKLEKSLKLF